jgi:hypothetical protein
MENIKGAVTQLVSKIIEDDEPKIEDNTVEISPEEQAFQTTVWDIFNNFQYIFSNYQMNENEGLDQITFGSSTPTNMHKCVSFYNMNAYEQMFSVCVLHNVEKDTYTVNVKDLKYNDLSKTFNSYDRREFVYQMSVYQQAIRHSLMYLPYWKTHTMNINLIEDVREALTNKFPGLVFTLGQNPIDNLDQNMFEYKIVYKDMHMGTMNYTLYGTDQEDHLGKISLTANSQGYISLSIPKDNKPQFDEFYFPSISDTDKTSSDLIKKLSNFLDFSEQFNNPTEFELMVKQYFEKVYKGITFEELKDESSSNEFINKTLKMTFEYATLDLHINTKIHEGNTVYNLKIYHPKSKFGVALVNIDLMRSSKSILNNMLDNANANRLLKPVQEDIFDMFKDQYKTFNDVWVMELKKENYGELKPYTSDPIFGQSLKGIKNKEFSCAFYQTVLNNKKLGHVKFISKKHQFEYAFSFSMENYDRFLVEKLMLNFFQGHS